MASKGHATLLDDTKSEWWILFHAYKKDYYNMGRQTLLEPVEWTKDDWFKVAENIKPIQPILKPYLENHTESAFLMNDNFK